MKLRRKLRSLKIIIKQTTYASRNCFKLLKKLRTLIKNKIKTEITLLKDWHLKSKVTQFIFVIAKLT